MSVSWTIAGQPLGVLGLKFAGGTFRVGAASEARLVRTAAYDAAPLFSYDQTLTIMRDGAPFFTGKVKSRPAYGRAATEGQEIILRDAWQDLEETIYLEPWKVGSGTFKFPIAVLGKDDTGANISTGQQISAAVQFAITAGVHLQLGTVPTGLILWPSEVRNVSVLEVIRISSRLHPDWVPWINHATSPPTLNFTARASLATRLVNLEGGTVTDFTMTRRDDLKPASVRLTYTNATIIDGVTYRDGILDKYPSGGPDEGPGVLSAVIELAGGQMQFQKSRIQTRTIPEDKDDNAAEFMAKTYALLGDVDPDHITVDSWERVLVPEDSDEEPEPINPLARRIHADDVDDLPRMLVKGSIEDWMQKKVGTVNLKWTIRPAPGATAKEKAAIAKANAAGGASITATNAITKIYKGITQWVTPEQAPEGIAQAVYEALSAFQYEGSVTIKEQDVSGIMYHGCKLNLSGGLGEWASMGALVNAVSFDIDGGTTAISIGPSPHLAANDFLELQRLMRGRAPTWMSEDERDSNELGAELDPGSKGDSVDGFHHPENNFHPPGETARARFEPYIGGEGGTKLFVSLGSISYCRVAEDTGGAAEVHRSGQQVSAIIPTIDGTKLDDEDPPSFDITSKSDASIWLIADRSRCPNSTLVPVESTGETDCIVIKGRNERPERVDGQIQRLLAKMDFESSGGAKSITNLKIIRTGDVDVWFNCQDDDSGSEESTFNSSDVHSSEASDDPDSGSDSDQKDCKWRLMADWVDRRTGGCYESGVATFATWKIGINLGHLKGKCQKWIAYVEFPDGDPAPYSGSGQTAEGGAIVKQLTGKVTTFGARFLFPGGPPQCVPATLKVTIVGYPDPEDSTPDECCSKLPPKKVQTGWPHWCGHSCSTIAPPP